MRQFHWRYSDECHVHRHI